MKTDDIFEALTDIDDKFLEEARMLEPSDDQPTVVRPAPKKPLWKTLVPIAACLAVVGTAVTIGVKYLHGHGGLNTSTTASSKEYPASTKDFQYPETAKYIVSEKYYDDPSLFNPCFLMDTKWDYEDTYAKSYEELVAQSDLIIAGEFADYAHQTQDPSQTHESSPDVEDYSLNYLRVENVIKGDIKAGQYVLICQNDEISAGGDRAVQLNSDDRLTPMFKGDRWIYFLKKNGDCYEPVNGPQGRYPMPGNRNIDVSNSGEIEMVDEYFTVDNAAPARDEIYDTVAAILEAARPKLEKISIPEDGSEVKFTMEEFPAFSFVVSNYYVKGVLKTTIETDIKVDYDLFGGYLEINDLYLADLNGDGKREICATIYEEEKGNSILVCDFAGGLEYNGDGSVVVDTIECPLYVLSAEAHEYEYRLAEEDGVLNAVKTEWHLPPVSSAPKELSREPLTLDMMEKMTVRKAASYELKEITIPLPRARNEFVMEEFPDYGFTATYKGVLLNGYDMNAVDVSIISGDEIENLFLCDLNGDGKRELCATVINDGVKSVEVVDFANDQWYKLQSTAQSKYSISVEDEQLILTSATFGVNGESLLEGHDPLSLDLMIPVIPNRNLTKLEDNKWFTLAEFPDKTFELIDGHIVMDDINAPVGTMRNSVIGGIEYYLTDLNGDGKREICAWGSNGSGIEYRYIVVYDIANDERYVKSGKAFENLIKIAAKDDVLYFVTSEYHPYDKEISREPLTLDLLDKVSKPDSAYEEIPLFIDQTFTKEDFPGVEFTVDTSTEWATFSFRWEGSSIANNVDRVYLYDADGDGKREICMRCAFAGNGIVRVYGYMDNGEIGCAAYYEDGGCWIDPAEDGTLTYCTNDGFEPFKFSKSDLRPSLDQGYSYEEMGSNRTLDIRKIAPLFQNYDISITDCTMKISYNDKMLFDSGAQLSELYTMYDKNEPSLTLVFADAETGNVTAIKFMQIRNVQIYHYENGVTLRPTAYELHIVNPDGSEEPFKFPENSETLPLGE